MARVLLLGANGQLGMELARCFAASELTALDRRCADLSRPETLRAVVRAAQPQLILNAAAYTAVDRAESEPELADTVNHHAPAVLAEEAQLLGAMLVHYSTDYVFDGSKPGAWVETDAPAPLGVYGASKLAGEQAVLAACRRALVLRTSWVYAAHGHNFLRTMLRLGAERPVLRVVGDQYGAPTSAGALAEATHAITDQVAGGPPGTADAASWAGVYHASCAGSTSWYGFAQEIFTHRLQWDPQAALALPRVERIASREYPTPARRPQNSVLDNSKLAQRFGVRLPRWDEAMRPVMNRLCGEPQAAQSMHAG